MLVQARVYPLCGRPGDGLSALIRYHKLRRLDYHAWHLLATIMHNNNNDDMRNHIAHAAIQRAIKIMTASQWVLSIDHVRRRYERELEQLQTLLQQIIDHQGNSESFFSWMQQQEKDKQAGEGSILLSQEQLRSQGLDMFNIDDIEYIYTTCIKHQDHLDSEENETRNVKDL